MSDLLEDDMEFRGGTLQLSTDTSTAENSDIRARGATESQNKIKTPINANPSVLSGADSLSSSASSFADARQDQGTSNNENTEQPHTVYPRYDVPFDKENIKDFFTFRKGVVENAIQECITVLLFPEDGEYLGSWLLTEITLWDNEKERIVLLTSRLVMTIKYDFIAMKQMDFKKTYLDDLDTVVIGELVYPPSSLVPRLNGIATGVTTVVKDCVIDRLCRRPSSTDDNTKPFDSKYFEPRCLLQNLKSIYTVESISGYCTVLDTNTVDSDLYRQFFICMRSQFKLYSNRETNTFLERNLRGVRIMWNKGEALPMKTLWNPFSQEVPFITFASHPIYWHRDGSVEERSTFDMETFAQKLQRAIENIPSSACCIHHSPIVIQSYLGLTSLLHNKTSMGFFKVRGKFSF